MLGKWHQTQTCYQNLGPQKKLPQVFPIAY
jgi:hypothetical protein